MTALNHGKLAVGSSSSDSSSSSTTFASTLRCLLSHFVDFDLNLTDSPSPPTALRLAIRLAVLGECWALWRGKYRLERFPACPVLSRRSLFPSWSGASSFVLPGSVSETVIIGGSCKVRLGLELNSVCTDAWLKTLARRILSPPPPNKLLKRRCCVSGESTIDRRWLVTLCLLLGTI